MNRSSRPLSSSRLLPSASASMARSMMNTPPSAARSRLEDDAASALVGLCSSPPTGNCGVRPAMAAGQDTEDTAEKNSSNDNVLSMKTSGRRDDTAAAVVPATCTSTATNCKEKNFPVILMSILSDPSNSDVVSWTPSGLSFVVLKPYDLADSILPLYSNGKRGKYCSFTRKLSRYGFRRVKPPRTAAAATDAKAHVHDYFSHDLFLRDAPETCREIRVVEKAKRRACPPKKETMMMIPSPWGPPPQPSEKSRMSPKVVSPIEGPTTRVIKVEKSGIVVDGERMTPPPPPSPPLKFDGAGAGANAAPVLPPFATTATCTFPSASSPRQQPSSRLVDGTLLRHSGNATGGSAFPLHSSGFRNRQVQRERAYRRLLLLRRQNLHRRRGNNNMPPPPPSSSSSAGMQMSSSGGMGQQQQRRPFGSSREEAHQKRMLRNYDPSGERARDILRKALEVMGR